MTVLFQTLRHMLGEENVASAPQSHRSLGYVNPRAGDIGAFVDIDNSVNWAAVHIYSQLKFGMRLKGAANRERAFHRGSGLL
jgi:hypothetical protein